MRTCIGNLVSSRVWAISFCTSTEHSTASAGVGKRPRQPSPCVPTTSPL